MDLIGMGAEAILYRDGERLVKKRVKKSYRLDALDEQLRKFRTRREARMLEKASAVIPVPKVLNVSDAKKEIVMEWIPGQRMSRVLDTMPAKERKALCHLLGEQIALLHNSHLIHGDLTTANFLLTGEELYFVDFGLSFVSQKVEDKAVDLHVLKRALESKHFSHWEDSYKEVLKGYRRCRQFKEVLKRLEKVESRGRYKSKSLKDEREESGLG